MKSLDLRLLTKKEINDRIQYWYSKYCNGVTKDEKQIYINLYKAYTQLDDYYAYKHIYDIND